MEIRLKVLKKARLTGEGTLVYRKTETVEDYRADQCRDVPVIIEYRDEVTGTWHEAVVVREDGS